MGNYNFTSTPWVEYRPSICGPIIFFLLIMPPKGSSGASKKAEIKKKEKIIEDKTFGLKNKKGNKNQKFIQQVSQQVKSGGTAEARKAEEAKRLAKEKKDLEAKQKKEIADLFRPVQAVQKIEKGADPKSILCAFFKQGNCGKGDRCKFSHNLEIERKAEIICKYFLDAVEKNKYGWFWECPQGEGCIYRHALPPGFQLKKDKKKEEKKDEISLEDLIERERAALGHNQTKVTLVSFLAWKKRKLREKEESNTKENAKRKEAYKAGRSVGISGCEMFTFNPDMANDDNFEDGDEAFDTANLPDDNEHGEDPSMFVELNLEELLNSGLAAEEPGTKAPESREFQVPETQDEATGGIPIDENLFADEDLEDLEEDLDNLEIED